MMGQYPFATLWGIFIDRAGPWACSLSASLLFGAGYSIFAYTIRKAGQEGVISTRDYYLLVFYFFLAGLGTVASYFSCLFSASKSFPTKTGLATGVVTALFGLSPLFLSSIGTIFFADANDGLDAPKYLFFLAAFAGGVNLLGAVGLRSVPHHSHGASVETPPHANHDTSETAPLLPAGTSPMQPESLISLLRDVDFWLLGLIMLICMGMSEMVVSNIGTIVASLAPAGSLTDAPSVTAGSQVRVISLANTFSRLLTGPTADFTSPLPLRHSSGELVFHPKRTVTRVVFVTLSSAILLLSFLWMAVGVTSLNGVWILSIGTGAAYGMIWTVVPSLTESVWGSRHAARNFGTISYAPFLGTPIFTLLYAAISDRARGDVGQDPICRGPRCWRLTFSVCVVVLCGAGLMSGALWRRWGKRV